MKSIHNHKNKSQGYQPWYALKKNLVHLTQTVHHPKTTRIKLLELILLEVRELFSSATHQDSILTEPEKKRALLRYQLTHFCIFHHFPFSIP